jgi:hypothetical protein
VKGDDLSANEVVSVRKSRRDREGEAAAVLVEVVGTPEVSVSVVAVLGNLEPGVGAVGRGSIADSGHVDDDGAVVVSADGRAAAGSGAGLLVHLNLDSGASRDTADTRGSGGSANVAAKVDAGDAGDGAVAGRDTDASAGLVDTVNPELLEGGVAKSHAGRGHHDECGLHIGCLFATRDAEVG